MSISSTMAQKIILAKTAAPGLAAYLEDLGYEVEPFGPIDNVQEPLRYHPDMVFCRLNRNTVFRGDQTRLSPNYPGDIIYNACSTGKFFIHNLKYTAPDLLAAADRLGLIKVNVSQGYSKCSICVVSENAVITYDRGIARTAQAAGIDVLEIEPGYVELPGYNTGFIGGAGGLVQGPGTKIGPAVSRTPHPILVFNGDLSAHPDHRAIVDFAEEKGVEVKFFADWKLTDIGSII